MVVYEPSEIQVFNPAFPQLFLSFQRAKHGSKILFYTKNVGHTALFIGLTSLACEVWSGDKSFVIQGAIDLKDPKRIVLIYQRAMIHLMEFNEPSLEHVFVIGHGIGTIAGHYPDKPFTVAEIDEKVVEISRRFFGYSKEMDHVVMGDGRQILESEQPDTYDYIILDAFTHKGTPLHFTTLEFFVMTLEKLKPRGAMIMNVMGKINNDRLINAMYSTLRETYKYTKVFSLSAEEVTDKRNMIFMASNRTIEYDDQHMAGFFEIELGQGHIIMD